MVLPYDFFLVSSWSSSRNLGLYRNFVSLSRLHLNSGTSVGNKYGSSCQAHHIQVENGV